MHTKLKVALLLIAIGICAVFLGVFFPKPLQPSSSPIRLLAAVPADTGSMATFELRNESGSKVDVWPAAELEIRAGGRAQIRDVTVRPITIDKGGLAHVTVNVPKCEEWRLILRVARHQARKGTIVYSDWTREPTNQVEMSGGHAMQFQLMSDAFDHNTSIPRKFTGEADDVSPALAWENPPAGTKAFALICDDPDAPTPEPWVHWVIYGIGSDVARLPEGVPAGKATLKAPIEAKQGKNSWDSGVTVGYRGPMPPPGHGLHHYHFKLYALDTELDLKGGATKDELLAAMKGHMVGEAELVGTYERR